MSRGIPARTARRLLRWLLPLCVLAASVVAVQGLFRVVGQPPGQPLAQRSASLRLGERSAGAPVIHTPHPTPPTATAERPAPQPAVTPVLTQPVVVVNASTVAGLATRAAGLLRRRGVAVASVGNLVSKDRPGTRTVYYPPGKRREAQALASLSGPAAVVPAPGWLHPDGRLVLVVTDGDATLARS